MGAVRLATWNVNSVRARTDRIVDWLQRTDTDVLAMQETKCKDEQFPYARFEELGYQVAHVGLSQWNGVAILSRVGLDDVQIGFEDQPGFSKDPEVSPVREARAIGATCGGVRVWSLYVPNGRELTDPHYAYKLDWLAKLRADAQGWLSATPDLPVALVGDWNVAPTDEDVWDPASSKARPTPRSPSATHSRVRRGRVRRCRAPAYARARRVHVLGLHAAAFPEEARYAHRLHARIAGLRREGHVRVDRPRRAQGQGASDHAPVIVDLSE